MQVEHGPVRGSRLAIAAGVVGLVVDLGYVAIIYDEAERTSGRVAVVFLFILAVSALAIVGGTATARRVQTMVLLGASTGGLLTVGVLGIFSIGLPLLVAGVMCAVAWAQAARSAQPVPSGDAVLSFVAAIASGAVLILGMALT